MPIHLHFDALPFDVASQGKRVVDHHADLPVHIAAQPNATRAGLPAVRIGIVEGDRFTGFALTMREFISAARAFEARFGEQLGMEPPSESELKKLLPFQVGLACIMAQAAKRQAPREELCAFLGDVALTVIETGKLPT